MGRNSRYETHVEPNLDNIAEWSGLLTEGQIAKRLGVSPDSFTKYKSEHPELCDALRDGKQKLVTELKETLKRKANGFHYTETKRTVRRTAGQDEQEIEETYERYSPPDTGAIHLLLKNLDDTWRNDDKTAIDLKREKLELERQRSETENW